MGFQEIIVQVPYRNSNLVGILTKPKVAAEEKKGIIFLNGGLKAKYGPGRLYVCLAKALSQKGYFVLRYDAPGLGDSFSNEIKTCHQTYLFNKMERGMLVASAKEVSTYFKKHYNLKKLAAFGLCGGGVNSCKLAASHKIVDAAIALNPSPTYSGYWGKSIQLDVKEYLDNSSHDSKKNERCVKDKSFYSLRIGNFSKEIYTNIFPHKNSLKFSKLKAFIFLVSILQRVPYGVNGYLVSSIRQLHKQRKKVFLCYSEKDHNYYEYCALLRNNIQHYLSLKELLIPQANHIVDEESHQKKLVSYICKAMNTL